MVDVDNAQKIKTLRFLLSTLLKHQKLIQQPPSHTQSDHHILQNVQLQNIHLTAQLNEIQRCLNSLSNQCRLQQEDHFELERRLMEFKFGQDPLMMSSDSVFENCSNMSLGDISIDMRNIETNPVAYK